MLQDYQIQEIAEKYVEKAKNFSSYAWHYISEERAIDLLSGAISDGLEAFALTSEVSELNRKLAEVEAERDALRELLSEALEYQRPDHMAVDCKCWVCRAEKLDSPAK